MWTEVELFEALFPRRKDNQMKNRYKVLLRRKLAPPAGKSPFVVVQETDIPPWIDSDVDDSPTDCDSESNTDRTTAYCVSSRALGR
jgi:hypothetical protein